MLKEEGMGNVVARHHRLAEGTRKAVEGWGLELLCAHPRCARAMAQQHHGMTSLAA
jgi:aspartate aminotransferase-like enzyme